MKVIEDLEEVNKIFSGNQMVEFVENAEPFEFSVTNYLKELGYNAGEIEAIRTVFKNDSIKHGW